MHIYVSDLDKWYFQYSSSVIFNFLHFTFLKRVTPCQANVRNKSCKIFISYIKLHKGHGIRDAYIYIYMIVVNHVNDLISNMYTSEV